jgi:hypothetical protein
MDKGVKLQLLVDAEEVVELNRKTLYASMVSKRRICNMSRKTKGVKLKLSGNVDLNQRVICVFKLSDN